MSLPLPLDVRFLKPGNELLIDLLNRHFGTTYAYTDLTFDTPVDITNPDPTLPAPNTSLSFSAISSTGQQGSAKVSYNRLNLELFLGPDQSYMVGDDTTTAQDVLDHIQTSWGVFLDPADVDVTGIGGTVQEDGTIVVTVTPHADNLIWNAGATIELVAEDHIGVVVQEHEGIGLTVDDVEGKTAYQMMFGL